MSIKSLYEKTFDVMQSPTLPRGYGHHLEIRNAVYVDKVEARFSVADHGYHDQFSNSMWGGNSWGKSHLRVKRLHRCRSLQMNLPAAKYYELRKD